MFSFLEFLTSIGFDLRSWVRWSRPGYRESNEDKTCFFKGEPKLSQIESEFLRLYPKLHQLKAHSSLVRYLENLNLIEALDQVGSVVKFGNGFTAPRVLEVGIKNWSTLPALCSYLSRHFNEDYSITGAEIDPWRVYQDLHSRWDYARYHMQEIPQASLFSGHILEYDQSHEIICIFLPFLFLEPHYAWGLPRRLFCPDRFFKHIIEELLHPGGYIIITNQGEVEYKEQARYLGLHDLIIHFSGPLRQSFLKLKYPRYGWLVQKP